MYIYIYIYIARDSNAQSQGSLTSMTKFSKVTSKKWKNKSDILQTNIIKIYKFRFEEAHHVYQYKRNKKLNAWKRKWQFKNWYLELLFC